MPLLAVRVIGPLSECSSSVRVEGQISGSTVAIFITGHAGSIGGGLASCSDQSFPLNALVTLTPGQSVYAKQTLGPQTSPAGPGITVQKKPPVIGPMAFQSHLYHCARCEWLVGAVPGAQVNLTVSGSPRGSAISTDGNARIGLTQQLGASDILMAQQIACGSPGPQINGPKPDPVPAGPKGLLPAPVLPGPLKQCDPAVLVTNVFEGATVTIKRSAGPTESACFDATGLWFVLSKPLVLNETVTAQQDFTRCEVFGTPTAPVKVEPISPVPPPVVVEPLCAGQTSVTLTDYQPGALIEIFQSGASLGVGQAPEDASFPFPTPALVGGDIITARQTLCGKTSVDSNAVPVDPAPNHMPMPQIPRPLYECSSVVRVENLHIGARVYVFSTMLGAEIGDKQASATTEDVYPVAPLLIAGDHIFARQIGCGLKSHDSKPLQLVLKAPKLQPPRVVPPLDDCMNSVPVDHVVPGALVDVDVNRVPRGTAPAGGPSVSVPISGRLHVGDAVTARQRLCGQITEFGQRVGVGASHAKDWPMYHRDPQHSGRVACSDITSSNVGNLKPAYAQPLVLDGHIISVPAVVGGKIYVGTSLPASANPGGGTMYRIDIATGNVEHTFPFVTPVGQGAGQGETGVSGTPAVVGGKVFFSALDGKIRCLDAVTFNLLWTTDLRNPDLAHNQPVSNPVAETWSSALVANNRVYVGAGEGEAGAFGFVYCLDVNSGRVIWLFCTNQFVANTDNKPNVVPSSSVGGHIPPGYLGFSVGPDPLSKGASVWSSCAYHAGLDRVYFGTGNPNPDSELPNTPYASGIVALDATSGALKGFFQPLKADSYRLDDSDVDVPAPPTLYSLPGQDVVTIASKNGASFLLDPATMNVLARRQLLPKDGAGNPLPNVDVHSPGDNENKSGVFACAAVDPAYGHLYFGLGGYAGVDQPTTPFLRTCDWATLDDEWPTVLGADTVTRYSTAHPPMYMSSEAGLSSPAVANDVVFVSTSAPALYAFASANGVPLWIAPGFPKGAYIFCLGPAIYGNYVVAGAGSELLVYTL
jgi:outer membrane protein assembly factor BamB